MPNFRLIPSDEPNSFIDFDGFDASSTLHVASHRHIDEADVYQDGTYVFTIRSSGGSGCWVIQTKPELAAPWLHAEVSTAG